MDRTKANVWKLRPRKILIGRLPVGALLGRTYAPFSPYAWKEKLAVHTRLDNKMDLGASPYGLALVRSTPGPLN